MIECRRNLLSCRIYRKTGSACTPSVLSYSARPDRRQLPGGVAEWLKAHAWKACLRETVTRVRIPLPPPTSFCKLAKARQWLRNSSLFQRGLPRPTEHQRLTGRRFSVSEGLSSLSDRTSTDLVRSKKSERFQSLAVSCQPNFSPQFCPQACNQRHPKWAWRCASMRRSAGAIRPQCRVGPALPIDPSVWRRARVQSRTTLFISISIARVSSRMCFIVVAMSDGVAGLLSSMATS